jgi:hypothetical protein
MPCYLGRLALIEPSHRCTCLTGYTDLEVIQEPGKSKEAQIYIEFSCGPVKSSSLFCACNGRKNVDYLLIAKPTCILTT